MRVRETKTRTKRKKMERAEIIRDVISNMHTPKFCRRFELDMKSIHTSRRHRVVLEVRRSSIPGAGLGVFAVTPIPRYCVDEYRGQHVKEGGIYSLGMIDSDGSMNVVDASDTLDCWCRYVNCSAGPEQSRDRKPNVRIVYRTKVPFFEFCRKIQPGEEILVNYGPDYWKYPDESNEIPQKYRFSEYQTKPKAAKRKLEQSQVSLL